MAVKLTFNDNIYTLEYNRSAILKLEKEGFNIAKVEERPLSAVIYLFKGAFYMHHPKVTDAEIDEIFSSISEEQRSSLMQALINEYSKPIDTLFKPVENKSGNVSWEVDK